MPVVSYDLISACIMVAKSQVFFKITNANSCTIHIASLYYLATQLTNSSTRIFWFDWNLHIAALVNNLD